jgi:hypothetical protein
MVLCIAVRSKLRAGLEGARIDMRFARPRDWRLSPVDFPAALAYDGVRVGQ